MISIFLRPVDRQWTSHLRLLENVRRHLHHKMPHNQLEPHPGSLWMYRGRQHLVDALWISLDRLASMDR